MHKFLLVSGLLLCAAQSAKAVSPIVGGNIQGSGSLTISSNYRSHQLVDVGFAIESNESVLNNSAIYHLRKPNGVWINQKTGASSCQTEKDGDGVVHYDCNYSKYWNIFSSVGRYTVKAYAQVGTKIQYPNGKTEADGSAKVYYKTVNASFPIGTTL